MEGQVVGPEVPLYDGRRADMVRSSPLVFFGEVVLDCGGDPEQLLRFLRVRPDTLERSDARLPYRVMVSLLEHAAESLNCPDFGLRLAKRQQSVGILGPLDVAMRNADTLGDAFRYCADRLYTYCTGVDFEMSEDADGNWMMRFDILLDGLPKQRQATEHALLATHLNIQYLSGGKAKPHKIWFMHDPIAPLARYRELFGCRVEFGQAHAALFLNSHDADLPVCGSSGQLYDLVTKFIDVEFPRPDLLAPRVRSLVSQHLSEGETLHRRVAAILCMHPRTLQRRLREEGASFEAIKNDVRRNAAWRYLSQTRVPLIEIAHLLGYSEPSTLSRSCHRWFACSPRAIRRQNNDLRPKGHRSERD